MLGKYYKKSKRVKGHSRFDPRINKRVNVNSYTRNQRYRNYKGISREQALKLFNQRSNRARAIDKSKTSKKVFEVPNEYWVKYMEKSDVKGIDTKEIKSKNKYTKMSSEELQDHLDLQNIKIRNLRNKMEKVKLDSEEYKKLYMTYQQLLEELTEIKIRVYNKKHLKDEDIRDIIKKGELGKLSYLAEKELPPSVSVEYYRIKEIHQKMADQLEDLSKLDVEIHNLKEWKESKEAISEKKKERSKLKKDLKESFEKRYAYIPDSLKQYEKFEKNYSLLNKYRNKFFEKDEEVPIIDLSKGYRDLYTGKLGCMDSLRISMLMTNEGYKQISALYDATKEGKKISMNDADLILTKGGYLLYRFDKATEYDKETIDRALKGFGEQKVEIVFTKETPIILKNKDLVFASAPRFVERDEITLDYNNPKKQPLYGYEDIKISQEDLDKLRKNNNKKDLMIKGNLPEAYKKYKKDKLIYHYIINTKTY